MSKIIKQPWKRRGYITAPTNSIREIGKEILGELDTATSFMYLFRRFGVPHQTTSDEYKILYSYDFKYKDMFFSIHASYYEHVYFNAIMPIKEWQLHAKEWKEKTKRLASESLNRGICYMPYNSVFSTFDYFPKGLKMKLFSLMEEKAKEYFSTEDYNFLNGWVHKDGLFENKPYYDKVEPFYKSLCKEFRASITKEELALFSENKIDNYPVLKKQCEDFFRELLRGYYVRDVAINIRGYESDTNNIIEYEVDNE